ncbi:uncharacterized protein LOC106065319 isoform X2 [Biomphalaria glabrata]|uniref:Uncharacterized protein LOC106065319 isoform X2 n=1 Tax=Biomphalaria glabrata TaxID=6526 RepID=A0A9W2YWU1_BIOGL|nr:uncharacterized protein LOC106065319 isoform X2 [Biomphalaria glabrata]
MKILVLAAFLFDCSFSTSCIEEGRSISLFFESNHTSGEEIKIAWYKGDSIVSICSVTDGCKDLDRNTVESSFEFFKDNSTFTTCIVIKKISRTDGVLWKLKYLGEAKIEHPGVLYSRELTLCDIKTTSPFSRFPQESSSVISNMKQEDTEFETKSRRL